MCLSLKHQTEPALSLIDYCSFQQLSMAYKSPHHHYYYLSNSRGQTCSGLAEIKLECTKGKQVPQMRSWPTLIRMGHRAKSQAMRSANHCWRCRPGPDSWGICRCSCRVACCSARSSTLSRCHRTNPRSSDWKTQASNLLLHRYSQVSVPEPTDKLECQRKSLSNFRLWSICLQRLKRRLSQRIVRTGLRMDKCLRGSSQASIGKNALTKFWPHLLYLHRSLGMRIRYWKAARWTFHRVARSKKPCFLSLLAPFPARSPPDPLILCGPPSFWL